MAGQTAAPITVTADYWTDDVALGAAALYIDEHTTHGVIFKLAAAKPNKADSDGHVLPPGGAMLLAAPILAPGDKVYFRARLSAGYLLVTRA